LKLHAEQDILHEEVHAAQGITRMHERTFLSHMSRLLLRNEVSVLLLLLLLLLLAAACCRAMTRCRCSSLCPASQCCRCHHTGKRDASTARPCTTAASTCLRQHSPA
jgi:hypothetical protein